MKRDSYLGSILAVFVIGFLTPIILSVIFRYFPDRTGTYKIISIEKVRGKITCEWMVYTDKQPLRIRDLLLIGFWNSGDIANELVQHKGQYCTVETRGARIPILSSYRNIIKIIKCDKTK